MIRGTPRTQLGISLAGTLLLLALFAAAGRGRWETVHDLRSERQALVSQAAALGLAVTGDAGPIVRHRSAVRPRVDRAAEARTCASNLIRFAKEMAENPGNEAGLAKMETTSELLEGLFLLDDEQVRILLDELRKSPDLKEDIRGDLIDFTIMTLAEFHPAAAILILTESADLQSDSYVIPQVLGRWAAQDQLATLDWVRKNSGRFPDLMNDETKSSIINGCAQKDPKLAFQLATELGVKNPQEATIQIVRAARTPEMQSAVFSALHELSSHPGAEESFPASYRILGTLMAGQGYDATNKWLSAAKPSPVECTFLADAIEPEITQADTGKWLDWMGTNLPPDRLDERAIPLFLGWTRLDFRAAGEWLATAPDGPLKSTAVAEYADAVALYQPAIAAKWAETLPADGDRDDLMRQIHSAWSKRDAAAAAVFAQKHGIQP